jgi:hypothetical protein
MRYLRVLSWMLRDLAAEAVSPKESRYAWRESA